MRRSWILCLVLGASPLVPAQGSAVVPGPYAGIRGNEAFALPLRLHEGLMQVHLENSGSVTAIPAAMLGQSLRSLTFRKPHEPDEPAYGTLSRTFSLRLLSCDLNLGVSPVVSDMLANRTAALATSPATALTGVISAQSFNIPATPAAAPDQAVGADLLTLPFASPFPFAGPDLFMELETWSLDTMPARDHWVDAVYGVRGDPGVLTELGYGGCAVRTPSSGLPMHLRSTGAPPRIGGQIDLELSNARSRRPSLLMIGEHHADLSRAPGSVQAWIQQATRLSLPGCKIWMEPLYENPGETDATGKQSISLTLPRGPIATTATGIPFTLQVAIYEEMSGFIEWSNGLALIANTLGFSGHATTVISPVRSVLNSSGQPVPPVSIFPPWWNSAPIMRFAW